MESHSSVLAWRIPWTEEPGWLQSIWSHRVLTRLKWLCTHAHRSFGTSSCHVLQFLVLINLLRLSLLALGFGSGLGLSYYCSKDQAAVTASTSSELWDAPVTCRIKSLWLGEIGKAGGGVEGKRGCLLGMPISSSFLICCYHRASAGCYLNNLYFIFPLFHLIF